MGMQQVTYTGYGFDFENDILANAKDKTYNVLKDVYEEIRESYETELNVDLNGSTIYVELIYPANNDDFNLLMLITPIPAVVSNLKESQPVITCENGNRVLLEAICNFNDETKKLITGDVKEELKNIINKVANDENEYWDVV